MKALFVLFATLFAGIIGMVIGLDVLQGLPEFGVIVAVAVAGALITHFNDKK